MDNLPLILESVYGIDIDFDLRTGLRGTKDVVANQDDSDFAYVSSVQAIAQELQRLFDLTPVGSCLGDEQDLQYGIDLDFIGTPTIPEVSCGLVKVAVLKALQHSSFQDRFSVNYLETKWNPSEPNAVRVAGILDLKGFDGVAVWFGPYLLRLIN